MKIVLFDFTFGQGKPGLVGLSDKVWRWAEHLVVHGEDVHIVAPYPTDTLPPQGAVVHRYRVSPLAYRTIIGHIFIVIRGWQVIAKLRDVDVIHAPEYLSTAIFGLLARRTPIILTTPGNIYERVANGNPFNWSATIVYKVAARLSVRFCTRIIVLSEVMRWWWAKTGAKEAQLVLIPNGVDTELFQPVADARVRLGISDDARVVLYVGRLSPEKGLHCLFEAFKVLTEAHFRVELHLVGDGIQRKDLERLSKELAIDAFVKFHGWVDQPSLPLYYSAANLAVMPSLSEPFGRVALEAMACGCPMLCTKTSGAADVIADRMTGFLVEPNDAAALARLLHEVLLDTANTRQVAEKARTYVIHHLGWDRVVEQMRAVYQDAVDER